MCAEKLGLGVAGSSRPDQPDAVDSNIVENVASYTSGYVAGDLIAGKYRLVRPIGRGGMGVVWEAYSQVLDIPVAVKLIQQFSAPKEMHQRLLLEARAAARLVDPGVIRVFDCGTTSRGDPYIVMELLVGEDLATRLEQRGRLAPIEAVRTLLPIVRALGVAHAAGIVHRDVKPENVFFTKSATGEEQPKLFDFGIAKVDVSWEKRLTQAGSTLGSPSYMSPEQAQGEDIDGRSDLWGICVLLYEVITGRLPFDGDNYRAIVHAILSADVKPFSEFEVDEPDLWAIVARGFERDRSLRWQTSADLADVLGGWLLDRGVYDDVTGLSLEATRINRRVRERRMLETERPSSRSGGQSPRSRSAIVKTVNRASAAGLWMRLSRPRRYLLVVSLVALGGAIAAWRIKQALRAAPAPTPSAVVQATPTKESLPAVVAAVQPASSETTPTITPAPAAPSSKSAGPAAAKATRAKPKAASPKHEPFKSPF